LYSPAYNEPEVGGLLCYQWIEYIIWSRTRPAIRLFT